MSDDRSRGHRNQPHGDAPGRSAASVNHEPAVLTTGEAAAALGLSPAAVRRAIAAGDLVATRRHAAWLIMSDEIVRFARQRNLPLPLVPRERGLVRPAPSDLATDWPAPSSPLIGRDAEVAQLMTLLADPAISLITLTGPGGIGKTRLALAVAEAMAEAKQDRVQDGAIFIDLSVVRSAAEVLPAIAQALGLRELAGQDQRSQLASVLRAKRLLLVLDNVEQIIDAAPEIARLANQATGTTLLVTSRAPLRVGGEREVPVPPLPLAGRDATPDELLASDAGRLFVERARAHDPAFIVDAQSAPLIAQICARLDGLPLAIELAAARARLLPPRQLRDRLERTLPLLTRGDRDAPPRHLTMRNAIAWSYDLLPPEEQRLFRQLATFPGGFTLEAAEEVGGDGVALGGNAALRGRRGEEVFPPFPPFPPSPPKAKPPPPEQSDSLSVLDRLDALLDQSMVSREAGSAGEPRYRMLETIRAFGLEQMDAAEAIAFRDHHARYFCSLARALRPIVVTESARAPLERLAAEDANLRAALAWLADQDAAAVFGAMVADLSGYWLAYSLLAEAASWIERAMAMREHIPLADRARLLIASAILSGFRGDVAQAEHAYAEGLPLSRATGDPFDLAMALTTYGASRNLQGQYAAAVALLEEGRTVAAAIADPVQRAAMLGRALANLSVTAREQGEFAEAKALNEAALECYQGLGFDLAETRAFMDLGDIARDQGELPPMVAYYQTCLARTGERGDMRVVYEALSGIASACTAWNQPRNAVLLLGAADAVRERVGLAMSTPADRAVIERSLVTLREALSDEQFAATVAKGRAMPLAEVLAIAATVAHNAERRKAAQPGTPFLLTRREREVLRLLAAGQTDREIAEALFIGRRTASWHVGAILNKLGVATRREAVDKAHGDGLL